MSPNQRKAKQAANETVSQHTVAVLHPDDHRTTEHGLLAAQLQHSPLMVTQRARNEAIRCSPYMAAQRVVSTGLANQAAMRQDHVRPYQREVNEDVQMKAVQVQVQDAPIQFYPLNRRNTRSGRTFRITNSGSRLDAVQIAGDMDDQHSGSATYRILDDSLILEKIMSDPEEGSGIGSLLMMFLAEIAIEHGKDIITIHGAASTAVGFYESVGAKSANEAESNGREAQWAEDADQVDTALMLYFNTRARIAYETDSEHHKMKRRSFFSREKTQLRWMDLSQKQKDKLVREQQSKFGNQTNSDKAKIITAMIHGKAVMQVGMTGSAETMRAQAEDMCSRWVDTAE
jgi:hypothetical protein